MSIEPWSGEALNNTAENEQFLALTTLESVCDKVRATLLPEDYNRLLSYARIDLKDMWLLSTYLPELPVPTRLVGADGPGVYINRSLHIELEQGYTTADIYEIDSSLPDGLDPCTERYRVDDRLPAYLLRLSGLKVPRRLLQKVIAFYPDNQVLLWGVDDKRNWQAEPL